MEQILQEKFRKTDQAYRNFIEESEKDMKESEAEVEKLRLELEKEKIITESLQRETDTSQLEFDTLEKTFKKYKLDLDNMNWQHDSKLKELETIRQRANQEIKKLSVDLSQA